MVMYMELGCTGWGVLDSFPGIRWRSRKGRKRREVGYVARPPIPTLPHAAWISREFDNS